MNSRKPRAPERRMVRYRAENLPPPDPAELERVLNMRDEDIDLSDIPELNPEDMERYRAIHISIRLEKELLDWFKRGGAGYQTRIRRALREHMEAHSGRKSQAEQIADAVVRKLQKAKAPRRKRVARARKPVRKRAA